MRNPPAPAQLLLCHVMPVFDPCSIYQQLLAAAIAECASVRNSPTQSRPISASRGDGASSGLDSAGKLRKRTSVAWSLQKYLIFAILSCVPDRQRTLRELELGRTLFKEGNRRVLYTLHSSSLFFCPVTIESKALDAITDHTSSKQLM